MSRIPGAMWGFVGYFAFFLLGGLYLRDEFLHEYLVQSFTLLQVFVFLWIGTNLLQDERIAKRGLFTYALGAVLLALGSLSHLPGFDTQVVPGRMTDLGQNPNALALHMAIAVVIAVGLWLCGLFKGFVVKLLALIVFIFPPLVVLIQTGSRGGILALAAGLLVYALPLARRRPKATLAAFTLAVLAMGATLFMLAQDPEFVKRWQAVYYEGSLSSRENIFPAALEMVLERPIFGWHPIEGFYELAWRLGIWGPRDAHNLLLSLMVEVGVLGTLPFLAGLWLCWRSAWRARSGYLGGLPLALLVIILASNMSGTNILWKPQWLVLALTLAVGTIVENQARKKVYRLVTPPPERAKTIEAHPGR